MSLAGLTQAVFAADRVGHRLGGNGDGDGDGDDDDKVAAAVRAWTRGNVPVETPEGTPQQRQWRKRRRRRRQRRRIGWVWWWWWAGCMRP